MARICRTAESAIDYEAAFISVVAGTKKPISKAEAITSSAVKAAIDLSVGAILAMTESGSTARWISKYKPGVHIVALTSREQTARQLLVFVPYSNHIPSCHIIFSYYALLCIAVITCSVSSSSGQGPNG
jgi:pyruvate kinase